MDILQVGLLQVSRFAGANTKLQRLARLLDRPQFPWKGLIVGFSVGQYLFEGFLSLRQYQILQHKKPPKALEGEVTQAVFDKSQVRPTPTLNIPQETKYAD